MDEVWAGDVLLAFDGRVQSVDEPNRKGRRMVKIKPATRGGGCVFGVDEDDWAQVGPFVDRVLAAIPSPAAG